MPITPWFQISDSGMVLEEQPAKISEAFRLFLQGEGYGKWTASPHNYQLRRHVPMQA